MLPISAFAVKVDNPWAAIMLMSLACGAHNGWMANIFTLTSDCFPHSAIGSVTGLAGFGGGLGAFLVSTFATGYIITWFGYVPIFVLMGILHPLAFVVICVLIKDVKIVGDGIG
jgi:ACS family hexuronate transporter-like MFS transporter